MSLSKGLVLHMRLDEESFNPSTKRFTDKTPYENHGTGHGTQLGSATPGFQPDRMGQLVRAAPFNGTDDYINCGNDASLNVTSEITLEVILKYNPNDAGSGTWPAILGKGIAYQIYVNTGLANNPLKFLIKNQATTTIYAPRVYNILADHWMHTVMTFNALGGKVYLNSVLVDIGGTPGETIQLNAIDLILGKGNLYFNGTIAEVRIYNRALSQQEITLLYESYRV